MIILLIYSTSMKGKVPFSLGGKAQAFIFFDVLQVASDRNGRH